MFHTLFLGSPQKPSLDRTKKVESSPPTLESRGAEDREKLHLSPRSRPTTALELDTLNSEYRRGTLEKLCGLFGVPPKKAAFFKARPQVARDSTSLLFKTCVI